MKYDPLFYFDMISFGILLATQYFMIKSSFSAYKHMKYPTFGQCIKNFISWVAIGSFAGAWLAVSHFVLR